MFCFKISFKLNYFVEVLDYDDLLGMYSIISFVKVL